MSSPDNGLGGPADPVRPDAATSAGPTLTRWQKFRMVVKVVELRLRFVALMAATGLVFGYWDTIWNYYEKYTRPPGRRGTRRRPTSSSTARCTRASSRPSREAARSAGCRSRSGSRARQQSLPAGRHGSRRTSPRCGSRRRGSGPRGRLRPARRDADDGRLGRVRRAPAGADLVEDQGDGAGGEAPCQLHRHRRVKAGEPLAELYSPELYQAIRELLLARSGEGRSTPQSARAAALLGDGGDLVGLAREKLGLWGITPRQVDEILAKGKAEYRVPILSPISGVVVKKNVVEGQYVTEGEAMFEVADLAPRLDPGPGLRGPVRRWSSVGQAVEATVEAYPGEVFRGRSPSTTPRSNPTTRTLDVRYDLDNADGRLRPGMFATVTLEDPRGRLRRRSGSRWPPPATSRPGGLTAAEQKVCPVTTLKLGAMGKPVAVEVEGKKSGPAAGPARRSSRPSPRGTSARLAPAPRDEVLTVPESAVIDTGTRKLVYVEAEPGVFEGRAVVLGPAAPATATRSSRALAPARRWPPRAPS